MMCPVCKRDLAPTLSICLTCGAMIHDTVREELETKISKTVPPAARKPTPTPARVPAPNDELQTSKPSSIIHPAPAKPEVTAHSAPPVQPPLITTPAPIPETPKLASPQPPPVPVSKPVASRFDTAGLSGKKTSPTLVEFQTKKATVPEWRLQLQNTVRQKVGTSRRVESTSDETKPAQPRSTNGANALKVEFVEEEHPRHQNPRVASALKRIEESRRTFTNQPIPEQPVNLGGKPAPRNYPFNVVAKSNETPAPRTGHKATVNASPKPILVSPMKIEKKRYDTNKLPPLAKPAKQIQMPLIDDVPTEVDVAAARERWENLSVEEQVVETATPLDPDEIEDLAPFSMRFAAGIFDMIVGVFGGFILLSPFILSGGDWFTVSGGVAVLAAVAIVMFFYLTLSIAFFGRTFGMRLFSLELVDIEENAYPSLHQAAVNSAVYLLSLGFAGLGFLTVFFNEERRAVHDILSGTILIREY